MIKIHHSRKFSLSFLLFLLPFLANGQQVEDEPISSFTIKVELKELPNKVVQTGGGMGYYFSYRGALLNAPAFIMNISKARVKTTGIVLEKYIYCEILAPFSDMKLIKDITLNALMKKYNFKTSFVEDTSEVWVLKKSNISKLEKFQTNIRKGGGPKDEYTWISEGEPIDFLRDAIERAALVIVYEDKPDKIGYNFTIPKNMMKSFDSLNNYLYNNYGISVEKKKKLEKFLKIDFGE